MGLIIYAIFLSSGGPEFITNEYIGMWMSGILLSLSGQLIYQTSKPPEDQRKRNSSMWSARLWFSLNGFYYGIMLVMSLIVLIGYAMYGLRVDLIVCSVLIVSIAFISFGVVILRWFSRGMVPCDCCYEMEEDSDGIAHPLMSFKMSVNTEKSKRKQNSCVWNFVKISCWLGGNFIVRSISFVILLLLVFGAVNLASIVNIPKRGRIVKVELEDGSGRFQKIHVICDGPQNSNHTSPTFIFESDFSHNYADFSDVQYYMTQMGRRSCIYDKPGLGFSDYLFTDQKNVSSFYHNFIKSIDEQPPYNFVGWGGGGSIIYQYAIDHPEMVNSLAFLDVFPDGIEFTSAKILKNLTEPEYEELIKSQLDSRKSIMNIINAIGVPLGLMPFIISPNSNTTNANEIAFWMRTEKTWITQSVFLNELSNQNFTNSVFQNSISPNISINLVISKHDNAWVEKNNYQCKSLGIDSTECQYQIEANNFSIDSQLNIVPSLNGGSVIFCTDNECSQAYYTFINPKYTAETLNRIYN